jgi:(S)-2-hydroxy-acid oxidase
MTSLGLRDNEAAYDRYKIKPRILVNVDYIDTSSEPFGRKVKGVLCFHVAHTDWCHRHQHRTGSAHLLCTA